MKRASVIAVTLASVASAEPDTFGFGTGRTGARSISDAGVQLNAYAAVAAPASAGSLAVQVVSAAGFAPGDLVMVLQVSAPFATQSGSPTPVDLTVGSAGRWELARVATVGGGAVTFTAPLTQSFGLAAQLVTLPEYTDLTVAAGASVVAAPWDGASGGVIGFLATGAVTINGTLDVRASGLRGAPTTLDRPTPDAGWPALGCTVFDQPATRGARKGEGSSAAFDPTVTGRGNLANAGGGAICNSAGGGGGANGGRGGAGGVSWSGDLSRPVGGLGGAPIATSLRDRLVFGGGGGAGHCPFDGPPPQVCSGGPGGGLIFIRGAGSLSGGGVLAANGGIGTGGGIGGGGGGAGGSVWLRFAGDIACALITADGAPGADTISFTNPSGPGGGGGGGRVVLDARSTSACAVSVLGRPGGTTVNPPAPFDQHYGAQAAADGTLETLPADGGVRPPRFLSMGQQTAYCGAPYRYSASHHPDVEGGGALVFSGVAPQGVSPFEVDASTGEVRWTPTFEQVGLRTFTLTVSSPAGTASQDVTVDVECGDANIARVGCAAAPAAAAALALLVLLLRRRRDLG